MSAEGRFTYIKSGQYPDGFEKTDKLALRKRAKYFGIKGTKLVYLGGPTKSKCILYEPR